MFALKKKKNKNSFLLGLCALIVAVAMVSVGLTLALTRIFTRSPDYGETNVLVIGNVDIYLHDEFPQQGAKIDPGTTNIPKQIYVENTGNLPCYVRLLVKTEWKYKGTASPAPAVPNAGYINLHPDTTGKWIKGTTPTGTSYTDYTCYYYQEPVNPGEFTAFFMQNFDFLDEYNNIEFDKTKFANDDFEANIKVQAQAIQKDYLTEYSTSNTGGQLVYTVDDVDNTKKYITEWKNITVE